MRFALVASLAGTLAPAGALAADYLSPEQARKLLFPQADRFEARALEPGAPWLQELTRRQGAFRGSLEVARQGSRPLGFVLFDEVIGKFERITFAAGVGLDGAVTQVEILAYRESHGHEVRLPAWRRQFKGRGPAAPLKVGQDIANISGATLSCTHVTDGVRRMVLLVDGARAAGWLP